MTSFSEITALEKFLPTAKKFARVSRLAEVNVKESKIPIWGLVFGSEDKTAPTYGLFGGVHGLERVGTHLALYFLESLVSQLEWDKDLRERLNHCRLISIPLINPGGMHLSRRSNPQGVDLMRNAPVECEERSPFLVGGHRIAPWLPWYRGKANSDMEVENLALIQFLKDELFNARAALTLDLHSGFGTRDQLWYPWAKSRKPFPHSHQAERVRELLNRAHPFHIYQIEPQSDAYVTSGDVWDYIYLLFEKNKKDPNQFLIPWTLEMGSWLWLKKNPKQLFTLLGPFNPVLPHRYRRIMRRHIFLLDFFFRLTSNVERWKLKE